MKKILLLSCYFYSFLIFSLNPSRDSCDFYLELEREQHCTQKNITYLTHYGYYYCSHFLTIKNIYSLALQNWLEETALCLQQKLHDYTQNTDQFNCSAMEKHAFSTHAECYRQSGFCHLGPFDQLRIIKNLIGLDLFFKLGPTLQQALQIGVNCTVDHFQSYERCSLL